MQTLFKSNDFKLSALKQKKELIGNCIYETVEKLSGSEKAPKVTGMIIDLPESELLFAVGNYENLEQKVKVATQLLSALNIDEIATTEQIQGQAQPMNYLV